MVYSTGRDVIQWVYEKAYHVYCYGCAIAHTAVQTGFTTLSIKIGPSMMF